MIFHGLFYDFDDTASGSSNFRDVDCAVSGEAPLHAWCQYPKLRVYQG